MTDLPSRLNAALEGRYGIERELGEGGMATVYLAEDVRHQRQVALKVLKPELAAVVGAERFLTEIRTTANLQHPYILPLFDSGEADGFLFYVMPYVPGETLRDRLDRERQLPVDEAVSLAVAVAEALQAAHEEGIIHRDIKPANVLLSRGQPLVADFGIALAVGASGGGRLTETGLSVGTPYYMSPEQATGDRTVGPASDVYALGCVLYEMLVGDPPFVASTAQAVLGKILQAETPSASASRPTIPAHVDATIQKALAKLPADRFRSAADFARALRDPGFRMASDTGSGAAGAGRGWGKAFWGRAAPVALAAAALGLLVGGWAFRANGPAVPTVRVAMEIPGLTLSPYDRIIISPDGQHLAMISGTDRSNWSLWVRRIDEADFRPIPGTEGARSAAFSPDGGWLVYSEAGALRRVSVLGGAPTTVPTDWPTSIWGAIWSDDDSLTVIGAGEEFFQQHLLRVAASGGPTRRVADEVTVTLSQVLPGSRFLLATDREEEAAVRIDLRTGDTRVLREGAGSPWFVERLGRLLWADGEGTLWSAPFDPDRAEITGPEVPVAEGIAAARSFAARFSVSESGTLVYGEAGPGFGERNLVNRLVFMTPDGTVTVDSLSPRPIGRSELSPDGSHVAFVQWDQLTAERDERADRVFIYELGGRSQPRQIAVGAVNTPIWSPDGVRVAYEAESDSATDIMVQRAFAPTPPTRVATLAGRVVISEWNRSGILLSDRRGITELRLGGDDGLDSLEVRTLFEEPGAVRPRLDPQGEWIAYQVNQGSSDFGIYARRGPEYLVTEKITDEAPYFNPWWAADGGALYLSSAEDRGLYEVVVQRDAVLLPELPRFMFDPGGEWITWSIPNRRFLGVRRESGEVAGERHFLVTGWFEELRRLTGN